MCGGAGIAGFDHTCMLVQGNGCTRVQGHLRAGRGLCTALWTGGGKQCGAKPAGGGGGIQVIGVWRRHTGLDSTHHRVTTSCRVYFAANRLRARVLLCWCVVALVCWCGGVLVRWRAGVLLCCCAVVLACWCAGVLVYVLVCVLVCWRAGVLVCWCACVPALVGVLLSV